ncbi:MAG TPA: PRC-barrel domain-containing protein [Trebonia sp.]|nr:PRC-barrel domain-containing protein [Trebonia sp.]
MPQAQLFRLGADVRCADGDCGKVKSLVIDRVEDAVTHLVVQHPHRQELATLVPLGLVDAGAGTAHGEVRLDCTLAEFAQLDPAEATVFVGGSDEDYLTSNALQASHELVFSWPYYAPGVMSPGAPGRPGDPEKVGRIVTEDIVPDEVPGEDEVARGEQVHAQDGDVGHVQGIVVDAGTGRVTSVLLREGHLLGRRTVLIPRSAIAEVGEFGFNLNITREQVQHLPHAEHLAG